jgi:16S rRNA (adenine1518-N6/adenine1519-N6)-dimethyltransferase
MESFLTVPPDAFDPPPRVHSAVVRMVPHALAPQVDFALFGELVQVAFSQRRKLLRHTLGKWLDGQSYSGHFDVHRRAEEVATQDYLALAQQLKPPSANIRH